MARVPEMTLDMLLVLELLIRRALDRVQTALAEAREAQKATERGTRNVRNCV